MSKALSRVRALITEIDQIQAQGRKSTSPEPIVRAIPPVEAAPTNDAVQKTAEPANVLPINARAAEAQSQPSAPEGKVFIQLSGKIAVQLQLEHTEEIVEVSQKGESIEIRFTDGKAIHLPLRSVA